MACAQVGTDTLRPSSLTVTLSRIRLQAQEEEWTLHDI